jgi:voltage-gated potassium channel
METGLRNRLLAGFLAMMVILAGGTIGYWVIGDGRWGWFDCLYMTVITVTTVGYGETLVGMDTVQYARGLTVVLLVFGTGTLVYFASTITAFIVEGDLRNILKANRLKKRIKRMENHVIVCGAGTTGRHIIEELISAQQEVVAVDINEPELKEIADKFPKADFAYIVGDATDDDVLLSAGLLQARGVVACLSNDKDNLYITVATRHQNPQARVIARASELSHVDKLKRAGADSVVSPNFIGGMRMVSEMLRPAVVKFLDEMLRDKRATFRIDEVRIASDSPLDGKSLREASIRERYGMTVLAVRPADDAPWVYNPEAGQALKAGMVLVVLGSSEQVAKLRDVMK